jgi:hypothetical protein
MFWLKYIWRLKSTTDVAFWADIRCKKMRLKSKVSHMDMSTKNGSSPMFGLK